MIKDLKILGTGSSSRVFEYTEDIVVKEKIYYDESFEDEFNVFLELQNYDLKCFPKLIDYDYANELLYIEKIKGKTLQDIVIDTEMSNEILKNLYDSFIECCLNKIQILDMHMENIMVDKHNKIYFIDVELFKFNANEFYIPDFVYYIDENFKQLLIGDKNTHGLKYNFLNYIKNVEPNLNILS